MKPLVVHGTPIDRVTVGGRTVLVKREDLSCPAPGPSFSKMRGVYEHVKARPERIIGVLDTYHSKGGWAVAYACRRLRKQCVLFWPRYKADESGLLRPQQRAAQKLGASLIPLQAGRSAILYHQAKRETVGQGGYMMPNALKLIESVRETEIEAERSSVAEWRGVGHVVISISSGTIAAGVLRAVMRIGARGFVPPTFHLHMGYSRSADAARAYILEKARLPGVDFTLIDEGYAYRDQARPGAEPPFPCNPYYDLKAWRWLCRNLDKFPGRVLFWNIGA